MSKSTIKPTGRESLFRHDEIIVSKTDLKGRLIYANDVFLRVSGYSAKDLIGQPHSIIRHPDMPRCVFKLLWDTISTEGEIFAYINNLASNGDHYWVLAHVTPSFDGQGNIIGYHSNRRKPDPEKVEKVIALYADLRARENDVDNRKDGMGEAYTYFMTSLNTQGIDYDEFVLTL